MTFLNRLRAWRMRRRALRHLKWLRRERVVFCNPNPRTIVHRRWNVPL